MPIPKSLFKQTAVPETTSPEPEQQTQAPAPQTNSAPAYQPGMIVPAGTNVSNFPQFSTPAEPTQHTPEQTVPAPATQQPQQEEPEIQFPVIPKGTVVNKTAQQLYNEMAGNSTNPLGIKSDYVNGVQQQLQSYYDETVAPAYEAYQKARSGYEAGTNSWDDYVLAKRNYQAVYNQSKPLWDAYENLQSHNNASQFQNGSAEEIAAKLENWNTAYESALANLASHDNHIDELLAKYNQEAASLQSDWAKLSADFQAFSSRTFKSEEEYEAAYDDLITRRDALNARQETVDKAEDAYQTALGERDAQFLYLGEMQNVLGIGAEMWRKQYLVENPSIVWESNAGIVRDNNGKIIENNTSYTDIDRHLRELSADNADGHNNEEIAFYYNLKNSGLALANLTKEEIDDARSNYMKEQADATAVMNAVSARLEEAARAAGTPEESIAAAVAAQAPNDKEYAEAMARYAEAQKWLQQIEKKEYKLGYEHKLNELPEGVQERAYKALDDLVIAYSNEGDEAKIEAENLEWMITSAVKALGWSDEEAEGLLYYAKLDADEIKDNRAHQKWYDWAMELGRGHEAYVAQATAAAAGGSPLALASGVPVAATKALETAREMTESGDQSDWAATAESWITSVLSGLASGTGAVDLLAQEAGNKVDPITGKLRPLNYNTPWQRPHTVSQAVGEAQYQRTFNALFDEMYKDDGDEESAAKAAQKKAQMYQNWYDLSVSMGESAAIAGLTALGVPGALLLLSGSAATSTMHEMHEQGYSDGYALAAGVVSGFAEYITEEYSLEGVMKAFGQGLAGIPGMKKALLGGINMGLQAFTEASEEGASDIVNLLADEMVLRLFNGGVTQMQANAVNLREADPSMSWEDAMDASWKDWVNTTIQDIKGGAISGGLMGAGSYSLGAVIGRERTENLGAAIREAGTQNFLLDTATAADEMMESVNRYNVQSGIDTDYRLGRLENGVQDAMILDSIRERLIELGEENPSLELCRGINSMAAEEGLLPGDRRAVRNSANAQKVVDELSRWHENQKRAAQGKGTYWQADWITEMETALGEQMAAVTNKDVAKAHASAQASRLQFNYERTKAINPGATVMNQVQESLQSAGMQAADAVKQGELMTKILSGEKLTDQELRAFDLNNEAVRKVFVERSGLTGIPKGNVSNALKKAYVNRVAAESAHIMEMQADLAKGAEELRQQTNEKAKERAKAVQKANKSAEKPNRLGEIIGRKESNEKRAEREDIETAERVTEGHRNDPIGIKGKTGEQVIAEVAARIENLDQADIPRWADFLAEYNRVLSDQHSEEAERLDLLNAQGMYYQRLRDLGLTNTEAMAVLNSQLVEARQLTEKQAAGYNGDTTKGAEENGPERGHPDSRGNGTNAVDNESARGTDSKVSEQAVGGIAASGDEGSQREVRNSRGVTYGANEWGEAANLSDAKNLHLLSVSEYLGKNGTAGPRAELFSGYSVARMMGANNVRFVLADQVPGLPKIGIVTVGKDGKQNTSNGFTHPLTRDVLVAVNFSNQGPNQNPVRTACHEGFHAADTTAYKLTEEILKKIDADPVLAQQFGKDLRVQTGTGAYSNAEREQYAAEIFADAFARKQGRNVKNYGVIDYRPYFDIVLDTVKQLVPGFNPATYYRAMSVADDFYSTQEKVQQALDYYANKASYVTESDVESESDAESEIDEESDKKELLKGKYEGSLLDLSRLKPVTPAPSPVVEQVKEVEAVEQEHKEEEKPKKKVEQKKPKTAKEKVPESTKKLSREDYLHDQLKDPNAKFVDTDNVRSLATNADELNMFNALLQRSGAKYVFVNTQGEENSRRYFTNGSPTARLRGAVSYISVMKGDTMQDILIRMRQGLFDQINRLLSKEDATDSILTGVINVDLAERGIRIPFDLAADIYEQLGWDTGMLYDCWYDTENPSNQWLSYEGVEYAEHVDRNIGEGRNPNLNKVIEQVYDRAKADAMQSRYREWALYQLYRDIFSGNTPNTVSAGVLDFAAEQARITVNRQYNRAELAQYEATGKFPVRDQAQFEADVRAAEEAARNNRASRNRWNPSQELDNAVADILNQQINNSYKRRLDSTWGFDRRLKEENNNRAIAQEKWLRENTFNEEALGPLTEADRNLVETLFKDAVQRAVRMQKTKADLVKIERMIADLTNKGFDVPIDDRVESLGNRDVVQFDWSDEDYFEDPRFVALLEDACKKFGISDRLDRELNDNRDTRDLWEKAWNSALRSYNNELIATRKQYARQFTSRAVNEQTALTQDELDELNEFRERTGDAASGAVGLSEEDVSSAAIRNMDLEQLRSKERTLQEKIVKARRDSERFRDRRVRGISTSPYQTLAAQLYDDIVEGRVSPDQAREIIYGAQKKLAKNPHLTVTEVHGSPITSNYRTDIRTPTVTEYRREYAKAKAELQKALKEDAQFEMQDEDSIRERVAYILAGGNTEKAEQIRAEEQEKRNEARRETVRKTVRDVKAEAGKIDADMSETTPTNIRNNLLNELDAAQAGLQNAPAGYSKSIQRVASLSKKAHQYSLLHAAKAGKAAAAATVQEGSPLWKGTGSSSAEDMAIKDRIMQGLKAAGDKWLYHSFSDCFPLEKFGMKQTRVDNVGVRINMVRGSNETAQYVYTQALVDRAGNHIGAAMNKVMLCLDETGKSVDTEKQEKLQHFLLLMHTVDRMSVEERAHQAIVEYEEMHPELKNISDGSLARLIVEQNNVIAKEYYRLLMWEAGAQNKEVLAMEDGKPMNATTAQKLADDMLAEDPWLAEKSQAIYDWWDMFMREWGVGGRMSAESYENMRNAYPHYVPTYRANDNKFIGSAAFKGSSEISTGPAIHAAKGSTLEILPIEDQFAMLASQYIQGARANELAWNFMQELLLDGENGTNFSEFGQIDYDRTAEDFINERIEDDADPMDQMIEHDEKLHEYRVNCWVDGKQVSAYVSKDIYLSFQNLLKKQNEGYKKLVRLGNTLTSPMKEFITGANPSFALRNLMSDIPTALINSTVGFKFMRYWFQAADQIRRDGDAWRQFQALGGTHANLVNPHKGFATESTKKKGAFEKTKGVFESVGEISESVTRFAEYLATIDQLGDTLDARMTAIRNSAEVTVDFGRAGYTARGLNSWVPYFNPAVQGVYKVFRSVIEAEGKTGIEAWKRRGGVVGRALALSIVPELLAAFIRGICDRDKDFEEVSDYVKDNYYLIPMGGHEWFKVRKNREWAAVFGNSLMRALEGKGGYDDPFKTYIDISIKGNFLPDAPWPMFVQWILDAADNKNYAGSTIVPSTFDDFKDDAPMQVYDENTTMLAYGISAIASKIFKEANPMYVDYILQYYMGDFWTNAYSWADMGLIEQVKEADGSKTWEIAKGVLEGVLGARNELRKDWVTNSLYSNSTMTRYYDEVKALKSQTGAEKYHNGGKSTGSLEEQIYNALYYSDRGYASQITALAKEARALKEGPEKDEIKKQQIVLAHAAMDFIDRCQSGEITDPVRYVRYADLNDGVANELIRLSGFSDTFEFEPTFSRVSSITDPDQSGYQFTLSDAQKDEYVALMRQNYSDMVKDMMNGTVYKAASDELKAMMLAQKRTEVRSATNAEFIETLRKEGIKSSKKTLADVEVLQLEAKYALARDNDPATAVSSRVSDELVRLREYATDFSFVMATSVPKTFSRTSSSDTVYVLNDRQKDQYARMRSSRYNEAMESILASSEYKNRDDQGKAAMLQEAAQLVNKQLKTEFNDWLAKQSDTATRARVSLDEGALEQDAEFAVTRILTPADAYSREVTDELVRLYEYSDEFSFQPSTYRPTGYNDPNKKGYRFYLTDAQKDEYQKICHETYDTAFKTLMASAEYKNRTNQGKAEMLDAMRSQLADEVKKRFLSYLQSSGAKSQEKPDTTAEKELAALVKKIVGWG